MAALLTSVGDSKDKLGMYLSECRRMGIKVLAPDVNESFVDFTAVPSTVEGAMGDIRFGLGAVRNVGANVVEGIRLSREEKGRFDSFHDFLAKVPLPVTNKRTVESLIKAGAFDSLGATRRGLLEIHEDAVDSSVSRKRNEANGQVGFDFDSLWDEPQPEHAVPDRPEWAKRDKLAFEREMLGLYVSDHPLAGLEVPLAKLADASISEVLGGDVAGDGEHVTVAGLITSVQHRVARNSGNQYGIISIEDFGASIDVMFLGKAYQEFAPALENDAIVVVRGRVSMRDDGMNLHASNLSTPDLGQGLGSGPLVLSMQEFRATTDVVSALSEVLIRHSGDNEVRLKLVKGDLARVFELPFRVNVTADLYGELKTLLGPNCLV
jgi:DNA polymerase-3 subunit alpha